MLLFCSLGVGNSGRVLSLSAFLKQWQLVLKLDRPQYGCLWWKHILDVRMTLIYHHDSLSLKWDPLSFFKGEVQNQDVQRPTSKTKKKSFSVQFSNTVLIV